MVLRSKRNGFKFRVIVFFCLFCVLVVMWWLKLHLLKVLVVGGDRLSFPEKRGVGLSVLFCAFIYLRVFIPMLDYFVLGKLSYLSLVLLLHSVMCRVCYLNYKVLKIFPPFPSSRSECLMALSVLSLVNHSSFIYYYRNFCTHLTEMVFLTFVERCR